MSYEKLKEEEPEAVGLLAYLNRDDTVTLEGLQKIYETDPSGAKARVGRVAPSVKQPGLEGDAPITVLCRRLNNAQQYSVDVEAAPAMLRLLLKDDPPSLLATGKTWYPGVIHAVDRSGYHAQGLPLEQHVFYDVKTQLDSYAELVRAVPSEFVRLDEDAPPNSLLTAGVKVEVAPPRMWACRANGALHLLCCADQKLPPPVFEKCLEVVLSIAESRRVALDAVYAGDQPDALPRFITSEPPLFSLARQVNICRDAPFARLLAAIPSAARGIDGGCRSIAHILLNSSKSTLNMLNAALKEAPSSLDPSIPGNDDRAWRVTNIDVKAQTVDLTADAERINGRGSEAPIHDIPFSQLRYFDAPPAYPPPVPHVGMYVNVVQRPMRMTAVTLTAQSLRVSDDSEEKVAQVVKRAKDFLGMLLAKMPAEAWAMSDETQLATRRRPWQNVVHGQTREIGDECVLHGARPRRHG